MVSSWRVKKQAREDLAFVETMTKKINEKLVNPFRSTNKTNLLNIVTGEKAISTDLVNAKSKVIQAMEKAKENGGDAIESPELVTLVQKVTKPAKSQTLIKIYQDETIVTRTLRLFHGAGEETRYEVLSHEWTDYPSSLFETDPRLTQGYNLTLWKIDRHKMMKHSSNQTFCQNPFFPQRIC